MKLNKIIIFLSNVQLSDYYHSLPSKRNCNKLFKRSLSKLELLNAVKWCGTNGNMVRTIKAEYFEEFVDYLYDQRKDIESVTFDFKNIKEFGLTKPISWVSKMYHILCHKMYPLFFNKNTMIYFGVKTLNDFTEKMLSLRGNIILVGIKEETIKCLQSDSLFKLYGFGAAYEN